MSFTFVNCTLQKSNQLLKTITTCNREFLRTKNTTVNAGNSRPQHRGIKRNDGQFVHSGEMLVTQNWARFHPGLNVIIGRNLTLNALEHGKVKVTCELTEPDWSHNFIQRSYPERDPDQKFYKKYFHVIPEKQHNRFKLKDTN